MNETKYRCKVSTGTYGRGRCGKPVKVYAQIKTEWNPSTRARKIVGYEPVCNFHASVIRRQDTTYGRSESSLVEITPEVEKVVDKALAQQAKREAELRAEKDAQHKLQMDLATKRAAEEQAQVWKVKRNDDTRQLWGESKTTPRWTVYPDGGREWDAAEVKVETYLGQQVIEIRNSSRLTPRAAAGLMRALKLALYELGEEGRSLLDSEV